MKKQPRKSNDKNENKSEKYAKVQANLAERLKLIELRKADLYRQKDKIELVQSKIAKINQQVTTEEDLRIKLELAQEQIKDLNVQLEQERQRKDELAPKVYKYKQLNLEKDRKLKELSYILSDKNEILSRWYNDFVHIKTQVEASDYTDVVDQINWSLDNLRVDDSIAEEWNIDNVNTKPTKMQRPSIQQLATALEDRASEIQHLEEELIMRSQDSDVHRLSRQLAETQDLLNTTTAVSNATKERIKVQEAENSKLRGKLKAIRADYATLSSQLLRQANEQDYSAKAMELEIEDLKRKQSGHEQEIRQVEESYKLNSDEMEQDLIASRERVLALIDEKSALDNELGTLRIEYKGMKDSLHFKDLKINELQLQVQDLKHEVNLEGREVERLKDISNEEQDKSQQMAQVIQDLKESLFTSKKQYTNTEQSLYKAQKEITTLKVQLEECRHLSVHPNSIEPKSPEVLNNKAIEQLSAIILSKDKAQLLNSQTKRLVKKGFGENFAKIVEAYEEKLVELKATVEELETGQIPKGNLKEQRKVYDLLDQTTAVLESQSLQNPDLILLREQLQRQRPIFEQNRAALKAENFNKILFKTSNSATDITKTLYGNSSATAELKDEIDQLRQKLATQASENSSLNMRIKSNTVKDHEMEHLRNTVEDLQIEKKQLTAKYNHLKLTLNEVSANNSNASSRSGKIDSGYEDCYAKREDLIIAVQCQAKSIEELLEPGFSNLEM